MSEIQIFNNPEFGSVRTVMDGDTVLFCGIDIATALGYARPHDAVRKNCKTKGAPNWRPLETPGGIQKTRFIPEGDVYRLIIKSTLPAAEKFESWVFDEVLPSIRKHGMYATSDKLAEMIADPANAIKLFQALKDEQDKRKKLEAEAETNKPKVLFADAVSASDSSILIGELAKLLRQNGIEAGQKRLFAWMRDKGFLMSVGSSKNLPTQKSMELGLFRIKETTICHSDGHTTVSKTPKVTGKGQNYFVSRFLDGTFTIGKDVA